MEKMEQRPTARRGRRSGRNHMTANIVGLGGEGWVRVEENSQEGGSSWEGPLKENSEISV